MLLAELRANLVLRTRVVDAQKRLVSRIDDLQVLQLALQKSALGSEALVGCHLVEVSRRPDAGSTTPKHRRHRGVHDSGITGAFFGDSVFS